MPRIQNDQLREVPVTKTIERRVFEIAYTKQEVEDILKDHARQAYASSMSDDVILDVSPEIDYRNEEYDGFVIYVTTDPATADTRRKAS